MAPIQPMDWNPDFIDWQTEDSEGTKYAVLEGLKDQNSVAFTYAFFMPAGFWDPAHHHTADARVVVVRGEMQLGYGDDLNKSRAQRYGVGCYLLVPALANHFDGADVDTVIIGTAVGPWETHYVRA